MNTEEEIINLEDLDTDIQEKEYEKVLDDIEEEDPQPFMIVLVSLGVVIALVTIVCIVFLIFKSGRDKEEYYVSLVEPEQELFIEDHTTNAYIVDDTVMIRSEDETEVETIVVEIEPEEETEIEPLETNEIPESSSVMQEISYSEEMGTQEDPLSGNEFMEFTEVDDMVTAKDVTNLRSVPSTLEEENIVLQLMNGEAVLRNGINVVTGWSRLDYNGQTVYAVSNYLTTDLNYKPPVAPSDPNRVTTQDGRVIIFTDHDDYITPKEYVNLRIEPSTSEGETTVRCQIQNGDTVHRTGYSPDSGWSRVEYNGEILYVVSSMIYSTEAVTEEMQ